jgi:hypothetical protein
VSTTPAAHLARLKVQHPTWTITCTEGGYLAVDYGRGQRVEVATLGLLEYELDHHEEPPT